MTNEISMLIQNIDNAEMTATISVLESLIQCYQKEILIQENCSCDISEFSIYQEADDASDKKSKIKMLWERFLKFIERIKIHLTKIDFLDMKADAIVLKTLDIVKEITFTKDECILLQRTFNLRLCVQRIFTYFYFNDINRLTTTIPDFANDLDKRVEEILKSTDTSHVKNPYTIDEFIKSIEMLSTWDDGKMSNKKSKRQKALFEDIKIDSLPPDEIRQIFESAMNVFMKVYNECYKHLVLQYRIYHNKIKQYMNQYINQKNNNQSNINTESFYVDDEFNEFDFYDEGFKDIVNSSWNGKGSNESKIKKILMFIPRLLKQLWNRITNFVKTSMFKKGCQQAKQTANEMSDDEVVVILEEVDEITPPSNGDYLSTRRTIDVEPIEESYKEGYYYQEGKIRDKFGNKLPRFFNTIDKLERKLDDWLLRAGYIMKLIDDGINDINVYKNFEKDYKTKSPINLDKKYLFEALGIREGGYIDGIRDLFIDTMSFVEEHDVKSTFKVVIKVSQRLYDLTMNKLNLESLTDEVVAELMKIMVQSITGLNSAVSNIIALLITVISRITKSKFGMSIEPDDYASFARKTAYLTKSIKDDLNVQKRHRKEKMKDGIESDLMLV